MLMSLCIYKILLTILSSLEDAFETQLVNLAGELKCWIILVKLKCWTIFDCMEENMLTQLIDECDNEGTTSVQRDGGCSVHWENEVDTDPCEKADDVGKAPSDTLSIEEHLSGTLICRVDVLLLGEYRGHTSAFRIIFINLAILLIYLLGDF
ncbi:Uncharacterized protein Fot_47277 [Forsythia ovata]|uniref:Uncharacterized protein n=1 Tax=Forsythia ovata TaxID=205694 RepID=A0ABD1QPW4_9LAMI